MNPSLCTEPSQLHVHSMHAGGWPKLGWQSCTCDDGDEVLTTHMLAGDDGTEESAYI